MSWHFIANYISNELWHKLGSAIKSIVDSQNIHKIDNDTVNKLIFELQTQRRLDQEVTDHLRMLIHRVKDTQFDGKKIRMNSVHC